MKVIRAAIALIHKPHNTVDTLARELVQVLVLALAGSVLVSVSGLVTVVGWVSALV
jgi:hypothetical protein